MKGHFTPHSEESKKKMREAKLRNPVKYWLGKELPKSFRDAQLKYITGRPSPLKGKTWKSLWSEESKLSFKQKMSGDNNPKWIEDRTLLVTNEKKHLDYQYKIWMLSVKRRDGWKCRIADENCKGRLEAHHILNWKHYSELRYEVNNGITLCHTHHPRGRENEAKLSPYLQELVLKK